MNRLLLLGVLASLALLVGLSTGTGASIITFDDLLPMGDVPAGYAGLTWATSTDAINPGSPNGYGWWFVMNNTAYSTPHSPSNYVQDRFGPNNLWFSFAAPVTTFNGAWFTRNYNVYQADQVRLRDDLGHITSWLDLTTTPQFLAANFAGSTTIWVERQGGTNVRDAANRGRYYTMDDITYNEGGPATPELSTWALLACSGIAGLALWRRRKA